MNDTLTHSALLPSGFSDLLPRQAAAEAQAINTLMARFTGAGYARVKPPLMEFEESLLAAGPGAVLSGETFRFMDPASQKMVGLRSDMTAQIARIAASRLSGEDRPLRLTYAGDVLRTRAGQYRVERQFTQAGCELIGEESLEGEAELCLLALLGLRDLGCEAVTVDLTIPRLLDIILGDMDLAPAQEETLRQALARRDSGAVDNQLLKDLLNLPLEAEARLQAFKALDLPQAAQAQLEGLGTVLEHLQNGIKALGLSRVNISIDPVEQIGFEYHTGLGFTLFTAGVQGPLGRGGRYQVIFDDTAPREDAVGFTLYMDTVCKALPTPAVQAEIPTGLSALIQRNKRK